MRLRLLSYGFALSLALGLAYFLVRMPFQVSDNVADMLVVDKASLAQLWHSEMGKGASYFRPFLWITTDIVWEHAWGHYFVAFKTLHVLQLVVAFVLFMRLTRIRSAVDLSAASFALVALIGMHTFVDNVVEAYPINTYLTILVATLLAANLAYGRNALWRDVAAVALMLYAQFTLETGVLVLVVLLVGYLVGFRGVSRPALAACGAILVAYAVIKFAINSNHVPAVDERSACFFTHCYDQAQLAAKFGSLGARLGFYLYNIVAAILTIFFAEPRAGAFRLVRSVVRGPAPNLALIIAVATQTASTLLVAFYGWRRRHAWRRRRFTHHDRLVIVALAVIPANAVLSFPYTKDVIVGPAGALFALAIFVALREALLWLGAGGGGARLRAAAPLLLLVVSVGWTIRALSVPYEMRRYAPQYQQAWLGIDNWLVEQKLETTPAQRRWIHRLQRQALDMNIPPPPDPHGFFDRLVDRR